MPEFDLDHDDLNNPSAAEEQVREFDVELRGNNPDGLAVKGIIGPDETIQDRCRREGATHVDIPLGTDPRMRREGRINTEQLGSICDTIACTFDRIYDANPGMTLDYIRAAVITEHPDIYETGFFIRYAGMFMLFTNPEITPNERHKCMQTILLKLRLERGEISGEEANRLIGDLMGVSGERQRKLYDTLRNIHKEEQKRRKK